MCCMLGDTKYKYRAEIAVSFRKYQCWSVSLVHQWLKPHKTNCTHSLLWYSEEAIILEQIFCNLSSVLNLLSIHIL